MIDEETYKKEIVRMWDTLRGNEDKGKGSCDGVYCVDCPLSTQDDFVNDTCTNNINAFKVIKIVEKWSKENPPKKFKVSRMEYDILKWLDKGDYKFIVRSQGGNLMIYYSKPKRNDNSWFYINGSKILSGLNELFQFVQWKDENPTSIQDVLEKCEVMENDD